MSGALETLAGTAQPHFSAEVLDRLREMVAAALPDWSLSPRTQVALLHISENATFDLQDPDEGRRLVVRVYRDGYHNEAEIRSELAWIEALRAADLVRTHAPVPGRDGTFLRTLAVGNGTRRRAVAFDYIDGCEPASADLVCWFRHLGRVAGLMHTHSRAWPRPPGFTRKTWDFDAALGRTAYWGRWQRALGLDRAGREQLRRAVDLIEKRLAAFGSGPDRFGLIHADLRPANLLVDGDALTVIDFDDCGFGWYAYDFAASVSFMEHEPIVPELMQSWVGSYREVAPLDEAVVAELPVFVMLRRILLLAWIASHSETPTAQELGIPYTEATLAMADDFLVRFS
jgi:Ser/Thr protein kinase RdoA (MazF antagonist)